MRKGTTVYNLLKDIEPDVLQVLIDYAEPSSRFGDVEIPDITKWRFCDVVDMSGKDFLSMTYELISKHSDMTDKDISKGSASEFVSLMSFIKKEAEKASKLMEQLKSEPDMDMVNAGISKMDRFGVLSIYYGISKDPRDWDSISEVPFGIMCTKLMMDKVTGEIQKEHNKIQIERSRQRA